MDFTVVRNMQTHIKIQSKRAKRCICDGKIVNSDHVLRASDPADAWMLLNPRRFPFIAIALPEPLLASPLSSLHSSGRCHMAVMLAASTRPSVFHQVLFPVFWEMISCERRALHPLVYYKASADCATVSGGAHF